MAAAERSSESITGRGLRRRVRAWFLSRLPLADTWTLTQRNVYILPTKAGLVFCATLVIMLLASINYQLNLGYVLTFLLAGSGVVSMHLTHGVLRGLTLHMRPSAPVVAGDAAVLDIVFTNPGKSRHALALHFDDRGVHGRSFAWVDIPAQGQETARVSLVPASRGWHAVPTLVVETVFPFGLFRAWTLWRPATRVLAYPRPETPAPPLPTAQSVPGERPLPNAHARRAALAARRQHAPGGLEEDGTHRRDGQPRHRRFRQPRAVAGLVGHQRPPAQRRRTAPVAPGRLGDGCRPQRRHLRHAPARPRVRRRTRRCPPPRLARSPGAVAMIRCCRGDGPRHPSDEGFA